MLCREIIIVYSQIHTKHINTLCGQNAELVNVKLAVLGFARLKTCLMKTASSPGATYAYKGAVEYAVHIGR
jgi:hypothetical protein